MSYDNKNEVDDDQKIQSQGLKVSLWEGFLQDLGIDRNLDTTRFKGFLGSLEKANNG